MPEVPESAVSIIAYLEPPSALARKGEFPDCSILFMEIGDATPAARKRVTVEFISLCRVTVLAWTVWICSWLTLAGIALILLHNLWANCELKDILIDSPHLTGGQALCVTGAVFLILLCIYYSVRLSCNQKADRILRVIKPTAGKKK